MIRPGHPLSCAKLAAGLATIAALGAPAAAQAVSAVDTSFVEPNGERVLQQSIEIAAPPARVWKGLVDEATIRAWNAPLVHVDLRNGGEIEEGFDPKGRLGDGNNIHHRIVGYLPERLLILQNISTPAGLPGAAAYPKVLQMIQLEPTATGTRVTLSHAGYGKGPDFDALYAFFAVHNPEFLAALKALSETPAGR